MEYACLSTDERVRGDWGRDKVEGGGERGEREREREEGLAMREVMVEDEG